MRSLPQFIVFFAVVSSVVFGIHYYLYARLLKAPQFAPGVQKWGGVALLLLALSIPIGILLSRVLSRPLGTAVAYFSYGWMGTAVVLLFLTFASESVRGAHTLGRKTGLVPEDPDRRTAIARWLAYGIGALGLGLTVFGVREATGAARVDRVPIRLKRFPKTLDGFRLVQISDVHVGPTIDRGFVERMVAQINTLDADLVAITGDLVDGSVAELREHVAPLANIKAKHGVFFVTGNHEYYSGADEWIAELRRLGIRVLRNERVSIGTGEHVFDLAGVDDWSAKRFGRGHGADLAAALSGRDASRALVLLAHQPKQARQAAELAVDLQLSGHTHAGQIFPWGFIVRLDQTFLVGLERLRDLQIYTNRGTGYWGPPVRVGAPPEISLLELFGEQHRSEPSA